MREYFRVNRWALRTTPEVANPITSVEQGKLLIFPFKVISTTDDPVKKSRTKYRIRTPRGIEIYLAPRLSDLTPAGEIRIFTTIPDDNASAYLQSIPLDRQFNWFDENNNCDHLLRCFWYDNYDSGRIFQRLLEGRSVSKRNNLGDFECYKPFPKSQRENPKGRYPFNAHPFEHLLE
ncbi:hypothetical protein GF386_03620 [Candidatus Pacearchaeota archaeon]|nr:hypothetical protein [Candidatus Pacearchaeota archaeon]MBD3283240.1 hypothetical protein [Candidatus Pacearchaeota archaeon]